MGQENIDPQEEGMPAEVQSEVPPVEELQSEEPQATTQAAHPDPVKEDVSTTRRENGSFVAQKRLWTVAFVCVFGILLIAACIKAIEPGPGQKQSLGSTNSESVNTPTAVEAVSGAPTATTAAATASVDSQANTTETVTNTETAVATTDVTTETTTVAESAAPDTGSSEALQVVTATETYNGIPVGCADRASDQRIVCAAQQAACSLPRLPASRVTPKCSGCTLCRPMYRSAGRRSVLGHA